MKITKEELQRMIKEQIVEQSSNPKRFSMHTSPEIQKKVLETATATLKYMEAAQNGMKLLTDYGVNLPEGEDLGNARTLDSLCYEIKSFLEEFIETQEFIK